MKCDGVRTCGPIVPRLGGEDGQERFERFGSTSHHGHDIAMNVQNSEETWKQDCFSLSLS